MFESYSIDSINIEIASDGIREESFSIVSNGMADYLVIEVDSHIGILAAFLSHIAHEPR